MTKSDIDSPGSPAIRRALRIYNRGVALDPCAVTDRLDLDLTMSENDKPFHNPFASLRALASPAAASEVKGTPAPAADGSVLRKRSPAPAATPKPIPRAVVRLERSGRGGKEVTVVEHLAITTAARDEWVQALKAALGCGGTVEDERLVLQGDQSKRLPALLQARGVKKVTIG
jgi:translation initiation factor 1